MLIEFSVKNYRSFRDEAVLSMEATKSSTLKSVLIPFGGMQILPSAVIYGKNGGGKSNIIRAFWLAVQFIRNAQRTQHEKAAIPVVPFALNDYSASEPTKFSFLIYAGWNQILVFIFSHKGKSVYRVIVSRAKRTKNAGIWQRGTRIFFHRSESPQKTD